jgi:uncharacterized coiled-coil DUF342 family protein
MPSEKLDEIAERFRDERDEWRDTARSEMAGRRAAEAEVARRKALAEATQLECNRLAAEVARLRGGCSCEARAEVKRLLFRGRGDGETER